MKASNTSTGASGGWAVKALIYTLDFTRPDIDGKIPVIGVGAPLSAAMARSFLHEGLRGYLETPYELSRLAEEVKLVRRYLAKHPAADTKPGAIYGFLPAKTGVGTSTICLGASTVLANNLNVRTLLMDCDLHAGPVEFLLKLNPQASLLEALEHSEEIDRPLWSGLISRKAKLDVVTSGEHRDAPMPSAFAMQTLLTRARESYEVICCDLPSALDSFVVSTLRECQRIFLVTSADLASAHFVRKRIAMLTDLGLNDRVSLIVSQCDTGSGGSHRCENHPRLFHATPSCQGCHRIKDLEDLFGMHVAFKIRSDHEQVEQAILKGIGLPESKQITDSLQALAEYLQVGWRGFRSAPASTHKFLEYFHVSKQNDLTTTWQE